MKQSLAEVSIEALRQAGSVGDPQKNTHSVFNLSAYRPAIELNNSRHFLISKNSGG
jgi:hypothetical protein